MVESRNTKGEALPSQGGGLLCHSGEAAVLYEVQIGLHCLLHRLILIMIIILIISAMCIILTTKMRDKNNRCIFVSAILFMI